MDRPRSATPMWLNATLVGKKILDSSDPGYRYLRPRNVQQSAARRYIGSKIALADISSATVAPLSSEFSKCQYPWLLAGDERDVTKIDGLNGLAPKLLHIYAEITHLSYRMSIVCLLPYFLD